MNYFKANFFHDVSKIYKNKDKSNPNILRVNLVKKFLKNKKADTILDLGSGVGFFQKEISNLNNVKKIYNIEKYKSALDICKKKFFSRKGIYICHDLEKSWINITKRKFDIITCFSVFQHIKNKKKFLGNIKKSLNKGGYLILTCPNFYFDFFRFSQRTLSIMKEKKIIPNFVNLNRIQNNSSMVNDGKKVSIFNSKIKAIDPFNLTKELESNGFRKIQIVWLKVHDFIG